MNQLSERGERAAKAVQILTKAREHITPPENWIVGSLFGESSDGPLDADQSKQSCALGAIMRATGRKHPMHDFSEEAPGTLEHAAYAALADVTQPERKKIHAGHHVGAWTSDIWNFNDGGYVDDGGRHEDILAAFDRAIESQCQIVREEAMAAGILEYDSSAWTGR